MARYGLILRPEKRTPNMANPIQTYRTYPGKLVPHNHWLARLNEDAHRGLPFYSPKLHVSTETMTLTRYSDEGYDYELEVEVCGDYEPAQHGGRTDPSWDAYWSGICAYYHREGKGWVELSLTDREIEQIEEFLGRDQYGGPDEPDYHDDCRY